MHVYFLVMQLLLTEKVMYGIPVVVHVDSHGAHIIENITVPSLEEGGVKCCNVKQRHAQLTSLTMHSSLFQFAPWTSRGLWRTVTVGDAVCSASTCFI